MMKNSIGGIDVLVDDCVEMRLAACAFRHKEAPDVVRVTEDDLFMTEAGCAAQEAASRAGFAVTGFYRGYRIKRA